MKKIITTISAVPSQEGTRVSYTYSEVDETTGDIQSRHNAGSFVAMQDEVLAAVKTLMDFAQARIDK